MAPRGVFAALLLVLVCEISVGATKTCRKPNWWCSGRDVCINGRMFRCPDDCYCGGGRCKPREPKCRGDLRNYDCISSTRFCLGGKSMRCAPGTWCGANRGSGSPCYITRRPKKCSHPDLECVDSRHYCMNGWKIKCLHGERCHGWGPCVKPM